LWVSIYPISLQNVVEATRQFTSIIQKHLGAEALSKYLN
ncbi:hypothetical protein EIN_399620, partial [Entamoeba invadens IP1]